MGGRLGDEHVSSREVILGSCARLSAVYGMRNWDAGRLGGCRMASACIRRGGCECERREIW